MTTDIHLVGYASGLAGAVQGSQDAPYAIKESFHLYNTNLKPIWHDIIQSTQTPAIPKLNQVADVCQQLAKVTYTLTQNKQFFTVIGGDHSSAIGTWSGARAALSGDLGLIWIDAHMDSHTPETTLTGNIHGMPLACLLGHGSKELTEILTPHAKIKPEHLCLIGIRSFENEEAELLKKLNIRIYFMDEVKERGLETIMREALALVTRGTSHFGVSLDIDGIDPKEAPATGVPEPDGISANELCDALRLVANQPHFIGAEVVEFNPHLDQNKMTEKLMAKLIAAMRPVS